MPKTKSTPQKAAAKSPKSAAAAKKSASPRGVAKADQELASKAETAPASVKSRANDADEKPRMEKLIVVVHGIGDQYRYATVQPVARQIATICEKPEAFPLGAFHFGFQKDGAPEVKALLFENTHPGLKNVGLAEVFWADIHQKAQQTHNTIEETKAWARTIVEHMRVLAGSSTADRGFEVTDEYSVDYEKLRAVLNEMIETIAVLDNLCFLAEKAGLFTFCLRDLLDDYVGAVQLVAEFKDYGGEIFEQMARTLQTLAANHKDIPIYIVAHSEGTVVAFHTLLAAFTRGKEEDGWVKRVRGLMTIGSPIDKHVVMWPGLWEDVKQGRCEQARQDPKNPIVWWNYYDLGDPVGFQLDSAREWLMDHDWVVPTTDENGKRVPAPRSQQPFFDFPAKQDIGFSRYIFPGEAHNEYWQDEDLFRHFLGQFFVGCKRPAFGDAVTEYSTSAPKEESPRGGLGNEPAESDKPPCPETKDGNRLVCWFLPYAIAFLILLGGTLVLDRACSPFFDQQYTSVQMLRNVLGISLLLAGVTVASRVPRLTKFDWWYLTAGVAFVVGVVAYESPLVSSHLRDVLDTAFRLPLAHGLTDDGPNQGWTVVGVAFVIAIASAFISRAVPSLGMKPLMGLSALATVAVLRYILTLPHVEKHAAVWPLLLTLVAFIYLWWLAALIFDLVFVWHRYIRSNATTELLKAIRKKQQERQVQHLVPSAN